jgi:hypothetical protein
MRCPLPRGGQSEWAKPDTYSPLSTPRLASLPLSVTVGRRLPCSLLEGRRGARERETRAEEASGAETESRARRADAEVGSTTLVRSAGWRDARGPSQRLTDDRQTLPFFLALGTPSFREAECACKPVNSHHVATASSRIEKPIAGLPAPAVTLSLPGKHHLSSQINFHLKCHQ